ncbi:ankyrin repeat domain family member sosondowah [Rhynchophorus ferrugineus]|uniref:ankyrin repeat domain family member sosondowah n=1 Tax=Rhynchophorus ferrugineus TaxID=354439 RepID=UPI003FCDA252
MASEILTLEEILQYFKENGGKVKSKDVVKHFKNYLSDPVTNDECRRVFKEHVNTLAHTKKEGGEKVLILRSQYLHSSQLSLNSLNTSTSSLNGPPTPLYDHWNAIGIPTSPLSPATPPRQPPPYRNPPPVVSPSPSVDSFSISSGSLQDDPPRAPPRRRGTQDVSRSDSTNDLVQPDAGEEPVSVKERMQKFNRMASSEEELLSPVRTPKSAEKDRNRSRHGEDCDTSVQTPLEPKKCQEWYVTASRGDYQELVKLAREEPRLVNKKVSHTVLHWGAKYGNADIIKIFAGKYKVDVNGKTGYTPLHISAQFGHKEIFKLLIEVYKADTKVRDYSGKMAEYYLISKEQKETGGILLRKMKGRKKQTEKDLGFLRIGSLNVRVKKTTEAFSNFLGVGNSGTVNPSDSPGEKMHKGWGSADNVNKENIMGAPKGYIARKRSKRAIDSGLSSTPTTPKAPTKNYSSTSLPLTNFNNDSDSDSAAGFDSNWKN